jgi:hypothetical protein
VDEATSSGTARVAGDVGFSIITSPRSTRSCAAITSKMPASSRAGGAASVARRVSVQGAHFTSARLVRAGSQNGGRLSARLMANVGLILSRPGHRRSRGGVPYPSPADRRRPRSRSGLPRGRWPSR